MMCLIDSHSLKMYLYISRNTTLDTHNNFKKVKYTLINVIV